MVNEGFPEQDTTKVSAAENPGMADALVASVLGGGGEEDLPSVPEVEGDEIVPLPGGLVVSTPDGPQVIREVQIREMTGADEERLAKAGNSKNQFHFFNTMLEIMTVRIGDQDSSTFPVLLKNMLIGDRESVIFGIRRLTYGDTFEVTGWSGCPFCDEVSDISFDLFNEEVIPVRKLADPLAESEWDVELRKGQVAHCRMLTGEDQQEIAKAVENGVTWPEQNSFILKRAVKHITDAKGKPRLVAAAPSLVVNLSTADRKKILLEVAKRAPGPQYTRITFTHPPCGKEVSLPLGLADLFQG